MAVGTRLSIYGANKYKPDIFDNLQLPEEVDKDTLIASIILECAELELLYTDLDFLKSAIEYWSRARLESWKRMARVLYEQYDPFINIKRDEVRTITQDRDLKDNGSSILKTNAWNDGNGVEREKNIVDNNQTGTVTTTEHFHVEGDSAITDAQDVLMKEMKARIEYDLLNIIVKEFQIKFCLQIY